MRGSDPDASVYYLAAMLESGEDARFIARRMIVLASEDIGNADPRALLVAVAAAQAVEHVGLPEARLNLAQAAIYLARAPKSNASYKALGAATRDVREGGNLKPPKALQSAGHPLAKKRLGKGQGYIYPHDDPAGFEVDYLPDELKGHDLLQAERLGRRRRAGLVRALADALGRHLAERRAKLLVGRGRLLEVVLDAAQLERAAAVPERVRGADVAVERHADAAGVDEVGAGRALPLELEWLWPKTIVRLWMPASSSRSSRARLLREAVVVAKRRLPWTKRTPSSSTCACSEYSQPSSLPKPES